MIVKFRFLRWFALAGSLLIAASVVVGSAMLTCLVALLWLGALSLFVRCPACDKSRYVRNLGRLRLGFIIPEKRCSNCERDSLDV